MAIVKWDPFAGLTNMHSQLDDMFNSLLASSPTTQGVPAIDIYTEDDNSLVAEIHTAGFDKDDIEVNVQDGMLEIRGEKHEKEEDKKGKKRNYMVRESHASFYRSVALPKAADSDNVEAIFDKGVLKVRVPYKKLPAPKRIAISTGKNK